MPIGLEKQSRKVLLAFDFKSNTKFSWSNIIQEFKKYYMDLSGVNIHLPSPL